MVDRDREIPRIAKSPDWLPIFMIRVKSQPVKAFEATVSNL